jgi:hypothetical protein
MIAILDGNAKWAQRTHDAAEIMAEIVAKRLVEHLRAIGDHSSLMFPAVSIPVTGEADVAGVADVSGDARKPQEIRQLRPLRLEVDKGGKSDLLRALQREIEAVLCRAPAVRGAEVCRMHGAGGGARKGNKNAVRHGAMVAESIALRREVQALARMARKTIAAIG